MKNLAASMIGRQMQEAITSLVAQQRLFWVMAGLNPDEEIERLKGKEAVC